MNKADKYLIETLTDILENGQWDENPRPKWSDGTPAHSKSVTQKIFTYDISKGEFPITTLRNTALKGGFYDIEAIYIKQTNIIEEMHPSIHSWWEDFSRPYYVCGSHSYTQDDVNFLIEEGANINDFTKYHTIGKTYGHTVKRYNLVNKLLDGLENNPFGRRHMINLWQEQQMIEDPKALVPCAYQTNWNIRKKGEERLIDLTLHQRSQDFCMTASINPAQYVMLGMVVCGHLTFKTGIKHSLGNFLHIVENCHVYDRHFECGAVKEILERTSTGLQPAMELICEPKDFYDYKWEDFKISGLEGIKPLSTKLEIAV